MTEAWFMLVLWLGEPTGYPYPHQVRVAYGSEAACLADVGRAVRVADYPGKIGVVCFKGVKP